MINIFAVLYEHASCVSSHACGFYIRTLILSLLLESEYTTFSMHTYVPSCKFWWLVGVGWGGGAGNL